MVSLAIPRPESKLVERPDRLAARTIPASTLAFAHMSQLDGRTRVIAVRTATGWQRCTRLRWDRVTVDRLRGEVREVVLTRGLRRVRLPMSWVPAEDRS